MVTPLHVTEQMLDQQAHAMGCDWTLTPSPDAAGWVLVVRCDGEFVCRHERRTRWAANRLAWTEMARAASSWRRGPQPTSNPAADSARTLP